MKRELFEKFVDKIPTLFTKRHAQIVYGLIRWLGCQSAVEIGSYHGYMTAWIARAIDDNGGEVVYAIDNFSLGNTPVDIHNNMFNLQLADKVVILPIDSQTNPIPPAQFVFIDGDHSLEGCSKDFYAAVNNGAECIVVHDTRSWWGPNEFVRNFESSDLAPFWYMLEVGFDQGLAIFVRREPISAEVQYSKENYGTGKV